ncbi:LysR family transcriptional regulator [Sphingomonas paucimobilis]|uniref:LysR family transcriptional regulator n=1 Tax=Sphingobium sp. DC-2 TaxID=1303256 RepID=UPI00044AF1A3|nr:LysR family transcriptional regulator [Sphingobium sp. DC-2]EZP74028.1 LysR family transcriptional regulator [Sphingomonas paucimobilis]
MSLNAIELRQLRYFVAVVRQRSFRGAAAVVHVSQPPLTRQVQQLEDALGVQLLIRGSKGVELTPAGATFYTEACNILDLMDQAVARARLAGSGHLGRLDVGVFGSAVLDAVPRIIVAFRTLYPHVEVVLHNMDREHQVQALRERRITIGFNRFFRDEADLTWETLLTEPMLVAVPSGHPLASRAELSIDDIASEPLVFYPRVERPQGFTHYLMRMFHTRNMTPNIVQDVDDVVTAVALVSSGLGLCLVVESARNLQLPGVSYVRLRREDEVQFDLSMIWRTDDHSPLLRAFLEVARG